MINKFSRKVTIYNSISPRGENQRRFSRFVIDKCLIYNQLSERADGSIQKIADTKNVIMRDVEKYLSPYDYAHLSADETENFFTVQIGDFVVLAEVDDSVSTLREFQELQNKYEENGFLVTNVNASIHGMRVDNIQITNA